MATEVILPKVDMDMATGRISRWLVAEGAAVKQGDPLFEIETDKAAMEIEAPASGTLRNIVKEGSDVPVGNAVAWIVAAGESFSSAAAPAVAAAVEVKQAPAAGAAPAVAAVPTSVVNGVRATPLARRIARGAGLDLASLNGTGPHGRIVKADVEDAIASRTAPAAAPAPQPLAVVEVASDPGVRKLFAEGSFREVPHDKMRLTIARRLVEAKSTVPHFYLSADCRLDKLLHLRADLNAGASAYKLSINDMIIKAWALALRDVPAANAT